MAVKVIEILGEITRENLQIGILEDYINEYLKNGKYEKNILFYINSGGGSLEVYSIIKDALSWLKGVKVYTICTKEAYSTAALIFNLGDERIMLGKETKLLFHEPLNNFSGRFSYFKSSLVEFEERYNFIVSEVHNMVKDKMTEEEVKEKMSNDWIVNPQEAVELGFATKLISNPDEFEEFIKSL